MTTLEELKTLTEAAQAECSWEGDWYPIKDFSDQAFSHADVAFITALSPATLLKLLEMIAVLKQGIAEAHARDDDDNPVWACQNAACLAHCRADEIERSL